MKKAFTILGKTIYGGIIVAITLVALALIATMVPIPGNVEVKVVKSGSMEPSISTGSIVVIKPAANYVAGDVITFGRDTKRDIPTTHRIVEVLAGDTGAVSYQTKGDANEEPDQNLVSKNEVIGKVLVTVPRAGFVIDFARTRLGFVLMIVVPALLVIVDEILTIVGEVRKMGKPRRAAQPVKASESKPEPAAATKAAAPASARPQMKDVIAVSRSAPGKQTPRIVPMIDVNAYQVVLR